MRWVFESSDAVSVFESHVRSECSKRMSKRMFENDSKEMQPHLASPTMALGVDSLRVSRLHLLNGNLIHLQPYQPLYNREFLHRGRSTTDSDF